MPPPPLFCARFSWPLFWKSFLVTLAVGCALAAVALGVWAFRPADARNLPRGRALWSPSPDEVLSAQQLWEHYKNWPDRADKRYKGKLLRLSGPADPAITRNGRRSVSFLVQAPLGGPERAEDAWGRLAAASSGLLGVTCHLADGQEVPKGGNVVLQGRCTGTTYTVEVADCVVIKGP